MKTQVKLKSPRNDNLFYVKSQLVNVSVYHANDDEGKSKQRSVTVIEMFNVISR